ncbi:MAG: serine hydrolase [Flavobacteriaceae bacterium]|nr:serine hydrolase [Flavobacteriaceae bacterium]
MLFTKNLNPIIGTTLLVLAFTSCSNFSDPQIEFQSAPELLTSAKELSDWISSSDDQYIQKVISDPAAFELQIHYSRRSLADQTQFEDYQFSYSLNQKKPYFYPASTVKLPASIFALEKLNEFENINRDTPFLVQGDTLPISTSRCIEQIFAVSDNKANNLLFEFLGADYYNRRFKELGFENSRISHRLSTPNSAELTTPPIYFFDDTDTILSIASQTNAPIEKLDLLGIEKGISYNDDNGDRKEGPFDFSLKNWYDLEDQMQTVKRLIHPELYPENMRFKINEEQRAFLIETMAKTPKELGYEQETYFDSYVKFLVFGDQKEINTPNIKVHNKVGLAYGTLTDTAYIVDEENQIDFFLSVTLLVNKNEQFNDGVYEYDELGIPFMAALGKRILAFEKNLK